MREHTVSNGACERDGTVLAAQPLETGARKGADSNSISHSKLRVLVAHNAVIVSGSK